MLTTRNDPAIGDNSESSPLKRPEPPTHLPLEKLLKSSFPQKTRVISAEQLKNKPNNMTADLPEQAKSFHAVEKYVHKGDVRFFKHNVVGSAMSPLEAAAYILYDLLAPGYAPAKANAHVGENGEYVGISSQLIPGFVPAKQEKLTEAHLLIPEVVKGNAIGLTVSLLFEEDDCHTGNIDLMGRRVDPDMSFWPVFGLFKVGNRTDKFIRSCAQAKFPLTAYDLDHLPIIKDAKPHFWPTESQPFISNTVREKLSRWANVSTSAFTTEENEVYKKFYEIPEFHYYKFRTCLKFLLIDDHIFETIIKQHVPTSLVYIDNSSQELKVCDMLRDHIIERKKILRGVLATMESFVDFLADHGEKAMDEIRQEFADRNAQIQESETRKWRKNPDRDASILINNLIEPGEVDETYNEIFEEARCHEIARAKMTNF